MEGRAKLGNSVEVCRQLESWEHAVVLEADSVTSDELDRGSG